MTLDLDELEALGGQRPEGDPPEGDGDPPEDITILDGAPPTISRLLSLCKGKGWAVTWVHIEKVVREAKNKEGVTVKIDPPRKEVHLERVVLSSDGRIFANAPIPNSKPLAALPVEFHGQEIPTEHLRWSGAGLNRYLKGERPDPIEVFDQLRAVIDHFMDFDHSFTGQKNLVELCAVWALNTYLLDAFSVVGYLWPNGEAGSGKSHLLYTLSTVSYLGCVILNSGSFAAVRDLADYGAALLFDDAEKIMDAKAGDPDKQALLLAGNRKGATIPIKVPDPDNKRKWQTRHINAYCPRAFSAIGLPIDTMASRTIFIPLLASGDGTKGNSDPLDHESWPAGIDRRRLVDDLWSLGLSRVSELPAYDKKAAKDADMSGRALQPWRALLATALWLQDQGEEGLYDRMKNTAKAYRDDNLLLSMAGRRTIVVRALRTIVDHRGAGGADVSFAVADLWNAVNDIARDDGEDVGEEGVFTPKTLGWKLRRLRLRRPDARNSQARMWVVNAAEVERMEVAAGLRVRPSDKTSRTTETTETTPDSDVSDVYDKSDVYSEGMRTQQTRTPSGKWEAV